MAIKYIVYSYNQLCCILMGTVKYTYTYCVYVPLIVYGSSGIAYISCYYLTHSWNISWI